MSEMRFTKFPASSDDLRVGVSRSASWTGLIIFLTYIKNYSLSFLFFSIFDTLRGITTFSECYSEFFVVVHKRGHF